MQLSSCPLIKLVNRSLTMIECESPYTLDSIFPNTSTRLSSRQALHLFHKSSTLLDMLLIKVPNFSSSSPAYFLDSDGSIQSSIISLLSPLCTLHDVTNDFEIFSAATQLSSFSEGSRLFMEEDGNMVYDEETNSHLAGYVSFVDPRSRFLGSRIVAVEGCIEADNLKDQGFYNMWRIMNGVAEGRPVVRSEPEHLNFQCFNGEKGFESEINTYAAAVIRKSDELDMGYNEKIVNFRVLDSAGNFVGQVFDQYYNFCLVKMHKMPTSELLLENGEKINAWLPSYTAMNISK